MASDLELLDRIESHIRDVASRSRDVIQVGAFRAFLSADSDEYLLSLAVPVAEPDDWAAEIEALDEVMIGRGRRPRLEYFHERYPTLETALRDAGYKHDMTAPVMSLSAETFLPQPAVPDALLRRLAADTDDLLDGFLRMQGQAYGMAMADSGWRPMMRSGLTDGRIQAVALELDGVLVSGASLIIGGGVAELAGVGTLPGYQRRGLAADVCSRLLDAYFSCGNDLCWLSATEEAKGVYGKLGFVRVGTQHNFGRPNAQGRDQTNVAGGPSPAW